MKKLYVVVASLFIVASFSSCQKKYTCTCVYPYNSAGTTTTTIKAYNRTDAKITCSDLNTGAKLKGGACAL